MKSLATGLFQTRNPISPKNNTIKPSLKRTVVFLNYHARKKSGKSFAASSETIQKEVLQLWTSPEAHTLPPGMDSGDLGALLDLTLEGCFSDSIRGGNKNNRSWEILNGSLKKEWFSS